MFSELLNKCRAKPIDRDQHRQTQTDGYRTDKDTHTQATETDRSDTSGRQTSYRPVSPNSR